MPGGALLRRHQISYSQVIMITTARVSTSYKAQYSDPIAFEPGDLLTLTGRSDNWNGNTWLWAVASKDGREGWIPLTLLQEQDIILGTHSLYSSWLITAPLSCHNHGNNKH